MRSAFIVLVLAALAACSTVTAKPQTTEQKYFALKQDYKTLLVAAVVYKKDCDAMPTTQCKDIVRELRSADVRVGALLQSGDAALVGDKTPLDGYTVALSLILTEVKTLLERKLTDEIH